MTLIIDKQTLRKVWSGAGEFWFNPADYSISSIVELGSDDEDELKEKGLFPFLNITNEEIIRSYINSLNNKKLSAKFDGFFAEECVERFWKYFNVYPEVSGGYRDYEDKYVLDRVSAWCAENSVDYKFELD